MCINLHHRCVARYPVSFKSLTLLLHRGARNFSDNPRTNLIGTRYYLNCNTIFSRTFRIYDDDRSNRLSLEEFQEGLRDYGVALSPEEVKTLFAQFDRDGSGSISFDELLRALRVRRISLEFQCIFCT